MTDLLTLSLIISISIEVIKKTPLNKYLNSWYQLLSLIAGVALGVGFGFSPVEGFLSAAAAMGFYDTAKLGKTKVDAMLK